MKKATTGLGLLILVLGVVGPVAAADYGGQPNLDNSWKGLPVCAEAKPKAPILYEPNHPALPRAKNAGEIRLQWTKVPQATKYNVYYGLSPKNYIYTATNITGTDYTVRFLASRTYYFAVQSVGNCAASGFSNEWATTPGGGGYTTAAPGFVPVSRTTPIDKPSGGGSPVTLPGEEQPSVPGETPAPIPGSPRAPKPAPKPAGLWETIVSFFGRLFGR